MEKKCIFCGTLIHAEASFCHHCGNSQIEKRSPALPEPRKKRMLSLLLLVLFLLGAMLWIQCVQSSNEELAAIKEETKQEEMTKSCLIEQTSMEALHYTAEDGERYYFRLSFSKDGEVQARRSKAIAEDQGKDGSFPSLLYVTKESSGEYMDTAFLNQLANNVTVEAIPQNGTQPLEIGEPEQDTLDFSDAVLKSSLGIGSYNEGDNIVRWTIYLKNGETLTLEQTITIELMEIQRYSWTEIPMNTLTELNTLLKRLNQTTDREQVVEVYLPPVTYDGGLELYGRSYRLYGSYSETGEMTTFTAPSVSKTTGQGKMEFYDICFEGSGGTGLSCQETLFLRNCVFEGWDTAVHIQNQGWSQSDGCTYRNNGIGLLFDCSDDGSFGPDYDENWFENNEIGVRLKAVHTKRTLSFDNTVFTNNGIDIDNQIGHSLNLEQTIFE